MSEAQEPTLIQSILDRCASVNATLMREHSAAYDEFQILWDDIRRLAETLNKEGGSDKRKQV